VRISVATCTATSCNKITFSTTTSASYNEIANRSLTSYNGKSSTSRECVGNIKAGTSDSVAACSEEVATSR
jgi:hypothetical protein